MIVHGMAYKCIFIIASMVRRRKLLLFVTLVFALVVLVIFHTEISRNVREVYAIIGIQDHTEVQSRKYLLTINFEVGRLGNKMFKYASLLGIAERVRRTPLVFPLDSEMEGLFVLRQAENHTNYNTSGWPTISETDYAYYDPVFTNLSLTNLRLDGFVQSWKYFQYTEQLVRQEFRLKDKLKSQADGILNGIRQKSGDNGKTVIVGVHVRRFIDVKAESALATPKSFFVKSFELMKSLLPGQRVIFVIAGDDLGWCKENLSGDNVTILEPASTAVHFAVLASCEHFIVSVGTFGWWAGWLTGGRVIFYKKFPHPQSYKYKGFHYEDYYPPSWIPVED